MPIERRLDTESLILWTTLRGALTIGELRDHIHAIDELGGDRFFEIVDAREAEPVFSPKELQDIAKRGELRLAARGMRPRAVVVNSNNLMSFGIAKMFAALVSPWVTVRVFDSVQAATDYIGAIVPSRESSSVDTRR